MPYSTDWRERCCEERITKPVESEQSDPHGRQGERIKDRSRPVCCSSCLLLVLFATRRTCYSSYLLLVVLATRRTCCYVKDLYLAHSVCG